MAKLPRLLLEGHVYHTISVTRDRTAVFADAAAAKIVVDAIAFVRREKAFVLAFAILPDHMHLVLVPREPLTISQVMQSIKGYSSRVINQGRGTKVRLWQPSFYDRIVRNDDHLRDVIEYVHANAVEAGLAQTAEDYPFASSHPSAEVDIATWYDDDRG